MLQRELHRTLVGVVCFLPVPWTGEFASDAGSVVVWRGAVSEQRAPVRLKS